MRNSWGNHTDGISDTKMAFKQLIAFSEKLENDLARRDYLQLLGMTLQNELLLRPILGPYANDECSPDNPSYFMGDPANNIIDIRTEYRYRKYDGLWKASLSNNIVLPWPWHSNRYSQALNTIGKGKIKGPWRKNPNYDNHHTKLYLPWGLIFIGGGNHSITAGVLAREGEVGIDTVYDCSGLYELLYTDGQSFYLNNGKVMPNKCSLWFAVIFEVAKGFSNKDPQYLWENCWNS